MRLAAAMHVFRLGDTANTWGNHGLTNPMAHGPYPVLRGGPNLVAIDHCPWGFSLLITVIRGGGLPRIPEPTLAHHGENRGSTPWYVGLSQEYLICNNVQNRLWIFVWSTKIAEEDVANANTPACNSNLQSFEYVTYTHHWSKLSGTEILV